MLAVGTGDGVAIPGRLGGPRPTNTLPGAGAGSDWPAAEIPPSPASDRGPMLSALVIWALKLAAPALKALIVAVGVGDPVGVTVPLVGVGVTVNVAGVVTIVPVGLPLGVVVIVGVSPGLFVAVGVNVARVGVGVSSVAVGLGVAADEVGVGVGEPCASADPETRGTMANRSGTASATSLNTTVTLNRIEYSTMKAFA